MKRLLREALSVVRDAPLIAGGLWVLATDTRRKRAERERVAAALVRLARETPVEERAACLDGLDGLVRALSSTARRTAPNGTDHSRTEGP